MLVGAVAAVAAAALVVLLVTADDDQGPRVRSALRDYAEATRAKDYQRLCDDIFSPQLVETVRSSGLPCEVALRTGLEDVRRPTLVVRKVEVAGDKALAAVHTDAANQTPADVTIRLAREAGAWRVASLAQAQPQPPAPRGP